MQFFVNGKPATKGSWKVTRHGALRPDSERERPWANAIAWTAKSLGAKPTDKPVKVTLQFFFARPKKPSNPFPSKSDVDKLSRSALDALTGIVWNDDQQVVDLHATKDFADERGPGMAVWITAVVP